MRNNQHSEPSLTNGRIEPQLDSPAAQNAPLLDSHWQPTTPTTVRGGRKAIGFLFVLSIAIAGSAGAFGWWSFERMQLLEQQLIATQDSFSKISEDAAGRINAITGKVSAAENTVLSGNESLKLRFDALESSIQDTQKKQQTSLTEHSTSLSMLTSQLADQTERSESLQASIEQQKTRLTQLETTQNQAITALSSELNKSLDLQQKKLQDLEGHLEKGLASNQQQIAQLSELKTGLNSVTAELSTLQASTQQDPASQSDIMRLQQDILILRSELDNRPAPKAAPVNKGPSLSDFDAYRAQTNRTISALQEQVRNLQKSAR